MGQHSCCCRCVELDVGILLVSSEHFCKDPHWQLGCPESRCGVGSAATLPSVMEDSQELNVAKGLDMEKKKDSKFLAWHEWFNGSAGSRSIVLLTPDPPCVDDPLNCSLRLRAYYSLSRDLKNFSIFPYHRLDPMHIRISVVNITMIGAMQEFCRRRHDHNSPRKDKSKSVNIQATEEDRLVLIEYVDKAPQRKVVCFLVDTEGTKDRFTKELCLWKDHLQSTALV